LVDEWAARFFEELDYINEGENGSLFAEMMRKDLPQVRLKAQTIQFLCVC
jgi:aarF domain-containing kinase